MSKLANISESFFNFIAGLSSIISFWLVAFTKVGEETKWAVIFLGIISFYILSDNVRLKFKLPKSGYKDIFEDLNCLNEILNNYYRNTENEFIDLYKNLEDVCDFISSIYSHIYQHKCSTCIKLLYVENNDPALATIVRDKSSKTHRKTGNKETTTHWLEKNSDFNSIYINLEHSNEPDYFTGHFLPLHSDYENTSLQPRMELKKFKFLQGVVNYLCWKLSYKSAIIVPLVPYSVSEHNKEVFRGYLCVDSPRNRTFNKKYDIEILKGIADNLYNVVDAIFKQFEQKMEIRSGGQEYVQGSSKNIAKAAQA